MEFKVLLLADKVLNGWKPAHKTSPGLSQVQEESGGGLQGFRLQGFRLLTLPLAKEEDLTAASTPALAED